MKYKILIPLLLLCFGNVFSQESSDYIVYYDSLYNVTNETNYKIKKVMKDFFTDEEVHQVMAYYKSGAVKAKGAYVNKRGELRPTGIAIAYYENGKKEKLINSPADKRNYSKEFEWYENGEKKAETEIIYDKNNETKIRVLQFWNKDGVQKIIDGNGDYEEDDKEEWSKGTYVDGYKTGVWIGKDKMHNFTYSENYVNGKLISGTSIDSKNSKHDYKEILKEAMPEKGIKHFRKNINKAIDSYIDHNRIIERYLTFTVLSDGNISDLNIIKGTKDTTNDKIDEKLITAFKKCAIWIPCIVRGNNVEQKIQESIVIIN